MALVRHFMTVPFSHNHIMLKAPSKFLSHKLFGNNLHIYYKNALKSPQTISMVQSKYG